MKHCGECGRDLPLSEFNKSSGRKDGLQWICRECNKRHAREYYAKNREHHIRVIVARRRLTRKAAHEYLAQYLITHPCVDCGEADVRVLDFDHREGSGKTALVTRLAANGFGRERIDAEIAKCDVRCRNCHARITYERAGNSWRQRVFERMHPNGRQATAPRVQIRRQLLSTRQLMDDVAEIAGLLQQRAFDVFAREYADDPRW
ncbi:hypothetical protein GCM10022287_25430 [Gryllotalpicola koreensis]|uniref:HNH endonuclease n=1 Tax=Gryllotalpicola koreensis TaxID=993086 RepID=A0ABP8A3V3_9MICO